MSSEKICSLWPAPALCFWLKEENQTNGGEFSPKVAAMAARGGHLDTLKWLRSLNPPCRLDEDVFDEAAAVGKRDILLFLREQDCRG